MLKSHDSYHLSIRLIIEYNLHVYVSKFLKQDVPRIHNICRTFWQSYEYIFLMPLGDRNAGENSYFTFK